MRFFEGALALALRFACYRAGAPGATCMYIFFGRWQLEVSRVRTRWYRGSLVLVATCPRALVLSRRPPILFPRPPFPSISLPHSSPPSPPAVLDVRRMPRSPSRIRDEQPFARRNHASAGTNGRREIRTGPRARLKYFNGVSMRRDQSGRYGAFRYVDAFL